MVYSINNGLVELDGHLLEPDVIFRLGKFTAEADGCETTLVISRRPAELKFEFSLELPHFFSLHFRETVLDSDQVNSLVKYGYFIADKKRVYFVSNRLREYTVTACGELHLSGLLKLLRQLRGDGLIDAVPSALVDQLREKRQKGSLTRKKVWRG